VHDSWRGGVNGGAYIKKGGGCKKTGAGGREGRRDIAIGRNIDGFQKTTSMLQVKKDSATRSLKLL
jgi:hypothetical protein